ncbi:hypothetical protein FT663_03256 [Candidozyma haemuli var. vulneris]|nr:hypothetical protein FT662_03855 [[Candida] haemuloni var. vulneris]KAF3990313.1 hypothetical protein FT663_03256 [[Candida] haemuloni var. vulneris]
MEPRKRYWPLSVYMLMSLALTLSVVKTLDVMVTDHAKRYHKCTPWYSLFFLIFTVYSGNVEVDNNHRKRMRLEGLFLVVISWLDVVNTWYPSGTSWVNVGNRVAAIVAHSSALGMAIHKFQETGSAW